jgi:hypothetical protein
MVEECSAEGILETNSVVSGTNRIRVALNVVTVIYRFEEGVEFTVQVPRRHHPSGARLSQNDQPDCETWAFEVGDVVACELRQLSNETHLVVACRRDETA